MKGDAVMEQAAGQDLRLVALGDILPMQIQARTARDPERFAALKESIRRDGILTPLWVEAEGDQWRLLAGEGRWLAATELEREGHPPRLVPVMVVECASERARRIRHLIENIQREDLSLADEISAVLALLSLGGTQEDLARDLGVSRHWVKDRAALEVAPEVVMVSIREGKMLLKVAVLICALPDVDQREELAGRVLAGDGKRPLTLEETRELIRSDYMLPLSGATWDLMEDGVGGMRSCAGCPYRLQRTTGPACAGVACYRTKARTIWARWLEAGRPGTGWVGRLLEHASAVFPDGVARVPVDGEWIDLDEQVGFRDLGHYAPTTWMQFLAEKGLEVAPDGEVTLFLVLHPRECQVRRVARRAQVRAVLRDALRGGAAGPDQDAETDAGEEDLDDGADALEDHDEDGGEDLPGQGGAGAGEAPIRMEQVASETMPEEEMAVMMDLWTVTVGAEKAGDGVLADASCLRSLIWAVLARCRPIERRRWDEVCALGVGDDVVELRRRLGQAHPTLLPGMLAVACLVGATTEASAVAEMVRGFGRKE